MTHSFKGGLPKFDTGGTVSNADIVAKLYQQELGRAPDAEGLAYYQAQLDSGMTPAQLRDNLDRSTEGYNADVKNLTSGYRSSFGRDPDQEGMQYWLGEEDLGNITPDQLSAYLKGGAKGTDISALSSRPSGYSDIQTQALTADPYSGRFAADNPYYNDGVPEDAVNVSRTQSGQSIQFTNPVTGQPMITTIDPNTGFTVTAGNNVLQRANVEHAINLAQKSGSLTNADADSLRAKIANAETFKTATGTQDPTFNNLYSLLGDPKATVVLNNLGVQIGEDADRTNALAEAASGKSFDFTPIEMGQGVIRTKFNVDDVYNNLGTELGLAADKNVVRNPVSGLSTQTPATPAGFAPATTGDFRSAPSYGLPGEIPQMAQNQGYLSNTQAGSGIEKTNYKGPIVTPRGDNTFDPSTGALLGAVAGYALTPADQLSKTGNAFANLAGKAINALKPSNAQTDQTVPYDSNYRYEDPDSGITYDQMGNPVSNNNSYDYATDYNYDAGSSDYDYSYDDSMYAKKGGLATPLMASGGEVKGYADGSAVSTPSAMQDIMSIISSTPVKGAAMGALFANLLKSQAAAQGQGVNRGLDMSKVGYIAPRTTLSSPARFVPYSQYGAQTPVPQAMSQQATRSPLNVFAQNPRGVFSQFQNQARQPMPQQGQPANRQPSYYTYGQMVNPNDHIQDQQPAGLASGGAPHPVSGVPTVEGRHDYRAGSRVTGEGDGTSDDIPAMLADGEYVFSADVVSALGNGSTKAGANRLDDMVKEIRARDRSTHPSKLPPDAKSPLQYLKQSRSK